MGTNKYNTKITMGRIKLNALLNWAYNYGKNQGKETSFRRLRDERLENSKQ